MMRLMRFFVLTLALLALCAPSVSLGMGARMPVWTPMKTQVSSATQTKVFSCKTLGGKRVLPCHPDQGVMAAPIAFIDPPARLQPPSNVARAFATTKAEAELPPPRRS